MNSENRGKEFWILAIFFTLFVIFLYGPTTKLAAIAIVHMDEMGASAAAAAMATTIVMTALAAKLLHLAVDRLLLGKLQAWRSR